MPAIHTKILHRFNIILHIAKEIWAMRKKKKNIRAQKHGKKEKEKGKRKIVHISK